MKVARFGLAVAERMLSSYWIALACRIAVPAFPSVSAAPEGSDAEQAIERMADLIDLCTRVAAFCYWRFTLVLSGYLLLLGLALALGGIMWERAR